ncbi:MAG TPA: THUMP domain-containing protein [Geobacterales bacterium]|nr:THUMP domain-containing protein [Geobacterales bacterium]
MKLLVTCKPLKEKKALEEILSLIFQIDAHARVDEHQIKPGLFTVETKAKKEEIARILLKARRSYIKKVIPVEMITRDLIALKELIKKIEKGKRIAVRCSHRFGVSSKNVEILLGNIAKSEGLNIDLENPDYVLIIEPVRDLYYASILSFLEYKILTGRKSI